MRDNSELIKLSQQCLAEEQLSTFVPISSGSAIRDNEDAQIGPVMKRRVSCSGDPQQYCIATHDRSFQGSVLGKNMILKSVYLYDNIVDAGPISTLTTATGNAPNFRIIPNAPLAALGMRY